MTDHQEWFSAAGLAGMPGLPSTERRVRSKAEREQWQHRERAGRGGGREYHINSLPLVTRAELIKRFTPAAPSEAMHHLGCRSAAIAALTLELPAPWYVHAAAWLLRPVAREILRRERDR